MKDVLPAALDDNNAPLLLALLTEGRDINGVSYDGFTALHAACKSTAYAAAAALLLSYEECNAEVTNNEPIWRSLPGMGLGITLFWASRHGNLGAVRALLAHGAVNVNRVCGGFTALWAACERGHVDCVTTLLAAGADMELGDGDGDGLTLRDASDPAVRLLLRPPPQAAAAANYG